MGEQRPTEYIGQQVTKHLLLVYEAIRYSWLAALSNGGLAVLPKKSARPVSTRQMTLIVWHSAALSIRDRLGDSRSSRNINHARCNSASSKSLVSGTSESTRSGCSISPSGRALEPGLLAGSSLIRT